jgi:uncharacterized protein YdeI (YjbR/CyaY-like superfamily)
MKPTFFETPAQFRAWLKKHHKTADELWVGYHRKASGKPSMTWQQSVDEALCFGWIDGLRKSVDAQSYKIRFTPRRPGSNWSAVNIDRVAELTKLKRMQPAGLAAFAKRSEKKSRIYAYEQKDIPVFPPEIEKKFKNNKKAWEFFLQLSPYYRKREAYWITSAKQEETRMRRLDKTIAACESGRRR